MKNLEIRTVETKGIKVIIKIDYDKGEASLVEYVDHDSMNPRESGYMKKHWIFHKRGLGYMKGWLDILEAMTVAVKECQKELEFSLAQSSRFEDDLIKAVLKETKKSKK